MRNLLSIWSVVPDEERNNRLLGITLKIIIQIKIVIYMHRVCSELGLSEMGGMQRVLGSHFDWLQFTTKNFLAKFHRLFNDFAQMVHGIFVFLPTTRPSKCFNISSSNIRLKWWIHRTPTSRSADRIHLSLNKIKSFYEMLKGLFSSIESAYQIQSIYFRCLRGVVDLFTKCNVIQLYKII